MSNWRVATHPDRADLPIDPSEQFDAQVSWWVIDELVGSELERTLDEFVPRWLCETWDFSRVDYSP